MQTMPRFFFDIENGESQRDEIGTDLKDLKAARAAAIQLSGEMMRDTPEGLNETGAWRCQVRDGGGSTVFVLRVNTIAPLLNGRR